MAVLMSADLLLLTLHIPSVNSKPNPRQSRVNLDGFDPSTVASVSYAVHSFFATLRNENNFGNLFAEHVCAEQRGHDHRAEHREFPVLQHRLDGLGQFLLASEPDFGSLGRSAAELHRVPAASTVTRGFDGR